MTFADQVLRFYQSLEIKDRIPEAIGVMNPYKDNSTFRLCELFYHQYYSDQKERMLLLGINPGRFGSGTTGISFTDPIKLEEECGIPNTLIKKPELSADFIYAMINEYGGPKKFFQQYFISAISPLGFTKEGKNINYYDDASLQKAITPFVIQSIDQLVAMNISRVKCFCIGEGKNFSFFQKLNEEKKWFEEIVPLAHPRFIMQYKRKQLDQYIADYLEKLSA